MNTFWPVKIRWLAGLETPFGRIFRGLSSATRNRVRPLDAVMTPDRFQARLRPALRNLES